MPFKSGNQLWKEGLKARAEQKSRMEKFFEIIADGGIETYGGKLEELAEGAELTKPELDFMDRFERLMPYAKSKPTQSVDVTSGGKVISGFQIIDATTNPPT